MRAASSRWPSARRLRAAIARHDELGGVDAVEIVGGGGIGPVPAVSPNGDARGPPWRDNRSGIAGVQPRRRSGEEAGGRWRTGTGEAVVKKTWRVPAVVATMTREEDRRWQGAHLTFLGATGASLVGRRSWRSPTDGSTWRSRARRGSAWSGATPGSGSPASSAPWRTGPSSAGSACCARRPRGRRPAAALDAHLAAAAGRSGPRRSPTRSYARRSRVARRAGGRRRHRQPDHLARSSTLRRDPALPRAGAAARRRGRSRPLLLLIDDAHALDEASAGLLAHLVAAAAHTAEGAPVRLLTVVSVRRAPAPHPARALMSRLPREEGAAVLDLGGLGELGLNEMLTTSVRPRRRRPCCGRSCVAPTGTPSSPGCSGPSWSGRGGAGRSSGRGGRPGGGRADEGQPGRRDRPAARDARPAGARRAGRGRGARGQRGHRDARPAARIDADEVEDLLTVADERGVCHLDGHRYRFDHPLRGGPRPAPPAGASAAALAIAAALAELVPSGAVEISSHLRAAGELAPPDDRRRWGVEAAEEALALGAWGDAAAGFALALDDDLAVGFPPKRGSSCCSGPRRSLRPTTTWRGASASGPPPSTWRASSAISSRGARRWPSSAAAGSRCPRKMPGVHVRPRGVPRRAAGQVPHLRARTLAHLTEVHFTAFEFTEVRPRGRGEAARRGGRR